MGFIKKTQLWVSVAVGTIAGIAAACDALTKDSGPVVFICFAMLIGILFFAEAFVILLALEWLLRGLRWLWYFILRRAVELSKAIRGIEPTNKE